MANSVKKVIVTLFAATTLMTSFASLASQNSASKHSFSGTIRFTGAIVAPPCVIGTNDKTIETQCWGNDGKEKKSSVSIKRLKGHIVDLPDQKGIQQFKWIDKENKLGLYTISYN